MPPPSDSVSHVSHGVRYTLRSEAGRLKLFAPPPVPPTAHTPIAPGELSPAALVAAISDRHMQWRVARYWNGDQPSYRLTAEVQEWPRTATRAVLNTLERLPMTGASYARTQRPFVPAEFQAPLLAALDNPDQFVVAHLMESDAGTLPMGTYGSLGTGERLVPDADGSFPLMLRGLRLRLRSQRPFGPKPPGGDPEFEPCTACVDPADAAAVRDGWHRRLDVPVVSVAHWLAVAATALPPLLWNVLWLRPYLTRRRRRRCGLCLRCGYDVRASADRCPECGERIATSAIWADADVRDVPALVSPPADR